MKAKSDQGCVTSHACKWKNETHWNYSRDGGRVDKEE
jgi:hypothetical protein